MSTARANADAASALLGALADGGVRDVVFSPGSRSTPLVLAASVRPDLRTWPVLDERVGGFLALGLARASDRPVVLVCTSGSAGAHWLPAVIEARQARVPLILLTADRPPSLVGSGAGQTLDQRGLFGRFVVHDAALPVPGPTVPTAAFAAFGEDALLACAAGPVHLNVPFDEPLWLPGVEPAPAAPRPGLARARAVGLEVPESLVDFLAGGRRGVVLVGPDAVAGPEGAAAVDTLGAALDWPVLVEAASGARFGPGDAASRVTTLEALLRSASFAAAHRPDRVLLLGAAHHGRGVAAWLAGPLFTVDAHGDRRDPGHVAVGRCVADPADLARALASRAWPAAEPGWRAGWLAADARARRALDEAASSGRWEGAIARATVEAVPAGGALRVASSLPFRDVDLFAPASATPRRVFTSRGASGIDGTIATALGEALALAPAPVVALVGDLACLHDAGGLLHAGELADAVNLTIVVPDNGGGGIFGQLPIQQHPTAFERCFLTPQRADLAALAAAARVRYQADPADLPAALAAAVARAGVDVVHLRVDRAASAARRAAAWAAAAAAVESAR